MYDLIEGRRKSENTGIFLPELVRLGCFDDLRHYM